LIASVSLHLAIVLAFAVARFSPMPENFRSADAPQASISSVKKILTSTMPLPKPKISDLRSILSGDKANTLAIPAASFLRNTLTNQQLSDIADYDKLKKTIIESESSQSQSKYTLTSPNTEFFGSACDQRKICYLVDASGSMAGLFSSVRNRLIDSINSLKPNQYFSIVFFGDDKITEFRPGTLTRAGPKAKTEAAKFIKNTKPAGKTNSLQALEVAMKIRDLKARPPEVIYFLTDAFELDDCPPDKFLNKLIFLLNRFAPNTKINTIAFWPTAVDKMLIHGISDLTGAKATIISSESQ